MELTRDEAQEVYELRYLEQSGKGKRNLIVLLLSLTMAIGIVLVADIWVSDIVAVLCVLPFFIPPFYLYTKEGKVARKYAREQVEGMKQ